MQTFTSAEALGILTKLQLKEISTERGIAFKSKWGKAQLIEAILTTNPQPKKKPARKRVGWKSLIRDALVAGQAVDINDFPDINPTTWSTIVTDLKNPKYAGPGGALKLAKADGKVRIA